MILYNVTVSVDRDAEHEWLVWMKTEHIPDVLATGHFTQHRFLRLLNDDPDVTGVSYAIQYEATDLGELEAYLSNHANGLREKHMRMFGSKTIAFRSVLEEV